MDEESLKIYLLNVLRNTPSLVESKIYDNGLKLNRRNDFFYINKYIDNFLDKYNNDKLILMPGLRGVGKTTLLCQLYDYLISEKNIKSHQILYLNLDRLKDKGKIDLQLCLDIFIKDINDECYVNNEQLFIFIDEVHYVSNWGLVGKIIYDETINVFMIFTGSDALKIVSNSDVGRRALVRSINPINFSEYLFLKYNQNFPQNMKELIIQLIFNGEIAEISKFEKNVQLNNFLELKRDVKKEWEIFINSGGLPFTLNSGVIEAQEYTLEVKDFIVDRDLPLMANLKKETIQSAYPLLNIIALQKPGTLSEDKLSNNLDISKSATRELLKVLADSLIIFKIEPYGSASKRERKTKEYYYWSTQIKAAIFQNDAGGTIRSANEILGILLENYVAYSLYRLKLEKHHSFNIFFDSRKGGVDFLVKMTDGTIIPIEVGIGKKTKKQITSAMDYYNSNFGIVISNTTTKIKKEDNIIFVPYITFTLF